MVVAGRRVEPLTALVAEHPEQVAVGLRKVLGVVPAERVMVASGERV